MAGSANPVALKNLPQMHAGGKPHGWISSPSVFICALSRLWQKFSARHFGALIVVLISTCAVCAPLITAYDPLAQNLSARLQPPSSQFFFGSDALGRDVLSRALFGARASLLIASAATLLAFCLGVSLGLVAGFVGGRIDALLSRLADIQQAIPYLILAIAVVAVLGSNMLNLIVVLGLTSWLTFFRVTRAQTLSLRTQEFVIAADASGASPIRIIMRHILPNVWSSLRVLLTVIAANIILFEAALGFLGLGVPPPQPSWGSLIADGRDYLADAWWITVMPGAVLLLLGLGLNWMSDEEG
jgi:peptide/nickel transport system permease protein